MTEILEFFLETQNTAIDIMPRLLLFLLITCPLSAQELTTLEWVPRPFPRPASDMQTEKIALKWLDPFDNPSGKFNPVASLWAASFLAACPDNALREQANKRLASLTFIADTKVDDEMRPILATVSQLAVALQWRSKIPTLRNEKELDFWESHIERLPEHLRLGPYLILADSHAKFGNLEKAIVFWMKAPILEPQNRVLAEYGLRKAADALVKLQRPEQAEKLRKLKGVCPI